jgi:hypothetical protein
MPAEMKDLWHDDEMWDDTVVAGPKGKLDNNTYRQLRDHLTKLGTDHPRAVVVDLDGLDIASVGPLAIFSTVHLRLAQWPGVPLLLAGGNERSRKLLAASSIERFVPVHDTVGAAVVAVDDPPPRRVQRTVLPNSTNSPRVARELVRRTCLEWAVGHLVDDAVLVANELVSNAVVHTPSEPGIRIELRRDLLSVAVYDERPGEVSLLDPGSGGYAVHGLLLVAQLATAWGCSPTSSGGKVVWATMRTTPGPWVRRKG